MRTFADRLKKSHGTVQRAPVSSVPWCGLPAAGRLEVQHVLRGPKVQPKLQVGAANDAFEQEADRVADQVMRMPDSPAGELPEEEEEKLVSPKADTGGVTPLSGELADRIQALEGGGSPLSEGEQAFFEPRFGADFSQVRVHTGPEAQEAARALNAQAFTLGSDIAFGPGRYAPGTEEGTRLMAHELTHVVQQGGGEEEAIQRAVDFTTSFSGISLTPEAGAVITGDEYEHDYADFSADGNITAVGDTAAELDQWDVGVLQDMIVNWEREYWRRDNADGRGRFVEQKFKPINTRFRDQEDGAATVWSADDEHQELKDLPKTPRDGRQEVSTTISTHDVPGGGDTINGEDVTGMDASDGTGNINIERTGTRFDTYISAHNMVTDEWRHLRRLNWNYQKSTDFSGSGGTLRVGTERTELGRHGPYRAGADAPLTSGTTANDAMVDDGNWTRRRVDGWT
ncbi:MAG: DUF4157 domain-containing protein [Desulfuromonadales bacterium]|nr:MAG: DUF4157 domain-containing protein [Desulfuromonadales bacterium]